MHVEGRRVAIAIVIFVVLSAGSVLAAGMGEVSTVPAGPLPDSFWMPEARVGDGGEYVWDRVRIDASGNATILNEHDLIGFEWLPPTTTSDHEGIRHEALMLHQWGWQPEDHRADPRRVPRDGWVRYAEPVYAIDLATERILSLAYLSEATADPSQERAGVRSLQRAFVDEDRRYSPACGPDSPFSGREVPLDRPIALFRTCAGFASILLSDVPHELVRAKGTQRIGEHDTILFSSNDGDLHVWYDPEIPFPLRIVLEACEFGRSPLMFKTCHDDEYDVLRLKEFRRGETPLPERGQGSALSGPAPEWELAPLVDHLPDESGIDHPFPASAALRAARDDPAGAEFVDILDEGYVTNLRYMEFLDPDAERRIWEMTAYDGERLVTIQVEQLSSASSSPSLVQIPGLPPIAPVQPTWTTQIEVRPTEGGSRGPWPSPSDAPAEMPTVRSMWERWRAFASPEYAAMSPNTWGIRIDCLNRQGEACSPYVERSAGVDISDAERSFRSILSESDHAGRGHEMDIYEFAQEPEVESTPMSVQSAQAGAVTLRQGRVWVPPASPVVLGSAFVAALASLAYLFLPALRTGVALFYARHTTPPDILRNRERTRMMATIRERPGIQVQELARALGRGRSPTEHHLTMLRRVGLVRIVREGTRRRVYAMDAPASAGSPLALESGVAREILDRHRAAPGIGARELARTLGVSPGTVSYHLGRLRGAGLLEEGGAQTKA